MGILNKINNFLGFGFGIINRWVFVYAFSTACCGVGVGMILASLYYTSCKLDLNVITIIGIVLIFIGTIFANIAHSILKKEDKQN